LLRGTPLTPDHATDALVAAWVAAGAGDPAAALAAVTQRCVAHSSVASLAFELDGQPVDPDPLVLDVAVDSALVARWAPWLVGWVREALLSGPSRHRDGVHHTSPRVVDAILDVVLDVCEPLDDTRRVLDPAVGGGAFLLGIAERMTGSRPQIVSRLFGYDIDPLAVETTRVALALWSNTPRSEHNISVGDFLALRTAQEWDLVVGNPPFLGQLKGDTARSAEDRHDRTSRWPAVNRYVDDSAAFLLASIDVVSSMGTVALIQPDSVMAATDATAVRAQVENSSTLRSVWVDDARRFSAAVDTIALICRRDPGSSGITLWSGVPPTKVSTNNEVPAAASWAPLLAAHRRVPQPPAPPDGPTLGDIAVATAGFRDQFYGLRDAVYDDPRAPLRLITSGLIQPLENKWGSRACRFDKRSLGAPGVDLDRVDPAISAWVAARLRPKVLVASQTKVIESIVDPDGSLVPCTPVVSIEPHDDTGVWHVAALLTCPVATARLVSVATGSALSADAVRVSASRLAELSLPADRHAWDLAASAAKDGDVLACGQAMLSAHGLADRDDLFEWWTQRIPTL